MKTIDIDYIEEVTKDINLPKIVSTRLTKTPEWRKVINLLCDKSGDELTLMPTMDEIDDLLHEYSVYMYSHALLCLYHKDRADAFDECANQHGGGIATEQRDKNEFLAKTHNHYSEVLDKAATILRAYLVEVNYRELDYNPVAELIKLDPQRASLI